MRIRYRWRRRWKRVNVLIARESSRRNIPVSMAAGTVLGLFPVLGATTVLCLAASLVFRLSLPVTQALNFLVYPLQLLLVVPFAVAGKWLFDLLPMAVPPVMPGLAGSLTLPVIHAVIAWALLSIPMVAVLPPIFRRVLERPPAMRRSR